MDGATNEGTFSWVFIGYVEDGLESVDGFINCYKSVYE